MTIEHEEAARLADQFCSDFKYTFGDKTYLFNRYGIAALIAEVRRELPAELFDGYAVLKAIPEGKHVSADHVAQVLDAVVKLIRARLEEGK